MKLPGGLKTVGELVDPSLDSPMTDDEMERLERIQERGMNAAQEILKAEIEKGESLHDLKHDPRMLWQRSDVFRTKAGGWKKSRKWHDYVVAKTPSLPNGLAESGKEADRLIQVWRDHCMHLGIAEVEE